MSKTIKNLILITMLCATLTNAKEINLFGVVKADASSNLMINSQDNGKIIHKYYSLGKYIKKGFTLAITKPKKAEVLNNISGYKINNIKIKSPISGYIVNDFISNGSVVNNGTKIAKIVSNNDKFISISVPNNLRSSIIKNKTIEIIYNNQKLKTKIERIIPVTNSSNDTFLAIASIKDDKLYIGSVCEVIINIEEK